MEQLYQDNPYKTCTFTLHTQRSYTDCLESYQYGARKETTVLRRNGRIPTKEIVLHFYNVYSKQDLSALRTKLFRILADKDKGIESVVSIELTRVKDGQPNNTVHFHFLLDDPRSERELRKLFNMACERNGLVWKKGYRIDYRPVPNGYRHFEYFTKYDRYYTGGEGDPVVDRESLKRKGWNWKTVLLFQKGTREDRAIQKFYEIGNWFSKNKTQLWKEHCQEMKEKYGNDPDVDGDIDEQEYSDDASCYDDYFVPVEMTQEAIEKFNASYEKYLADRDRPATRRHSLVALRTQGTERVYRSGWSGKHYYHNLFQPTKLALATHATAYIKAHNNFNTMKKEIIMTNEIIDDVTIHSNQEETIMQKTRIQSLTSRTPEEVCADDHYRELFGDKPPSFKPVPKHINRDNLPPLKLKASVRPIARFNKVTKTQEQWYRLSCKQKDSVSSGLDRGILNDLWDLSRLYGVDAVEQAIMQELGVPVYPILKLIYQRHSPFDLNHGFVPEGDIPKQADGEYNADDVDNEKLAPAEAEERDMPKKTVKKSTKVAMKSTNWSKQLAKEAPVKLSSILLNDTFRCREQEHEPTVNKYARSFKAYINNRDDVNQEEKLDYPFPPIVIWRDESMEEGQYILVTGFHRYHAAEKEGLDPILAQEFTGTEKEALLFALEDNRHGRKMSSDDLKYAIGKALKEFPGISQGMIAQKIGCDPAYVCRIRKQLLTSQELTETETVVGLDGRVRKTARKTNAINANEVSPNATPPPRMHKKPPQKLKDEVKGIIDLLAGIEKDCTHDDYRMYIYETMSKWAGKKMTKLEETQE